MRERERGRIFLVLLPVSQRPAMPAPAMVCLEDFSYRHRRGGSMEFLRRETPAFSVPLHHATPQPSTPPFFEMPSFLDTAVALLVEEA